MSARPGASPFPIVAWLERRSTAQKRIAMAIALLVALFIVARVIAGMALDFWWFDTVTEADVWATKTGSQVVLALISLFVGGLVVVGSTWFAHRTSPAVGNRPNRLVLGYRQRMGPAHAWILIGLALLVALRGAATAMGQWQRWLLFLHGPGQGSQVPHVGWDLGYHLFQLPFLHIASDWIRLTVLYGLGLAIIAYIANGALKIHRGDRRSAPRALAHLGIGAAVFAFLQALGYIFVTWPETATSRFGAFNGAGFTQVRFVIPSLWLLAILAIVTGALTVRAVRTGKWRPAGIAFASWGALQVVLMVALPALVTRFVVDPAEGELQLPYITNNLDATRTAFSLESVEQVTRVVSDGLDDPPPESVDPDLDSMPVFAERFLISPLQVLKGTTATRITDVDLDRYTIDGERRPVFVAARNTDRADLPEKGWVQEHLVYTHGDGVVAVPADSTSPDGRPDVDAFTTILEGVEADLYFGENLRGWYVIVGTDRTEVGGSEFSGEAAIDLGSLWRRLALSLTVRDVEPLVSAELGPDSRLLYRRDILERLEYLAPFLQFEADPYPVIAGGRIVWVVDGYTTSASYPYSQYAQSLGVSGGAGLPAGGFNYMHASVRATVDAYDGSVHLYRTDIEGPADPVLEAWVSIFPGLFQPISDMPGEVRSHLLYPEEMLNVQTAVLGRYHVSDAETLFNGSDSWAISVAAEDQVARGGGNNESAPGPAPAVSLFMPSTEPLGGHWVAIRPYGAGAASIPTSTREELSAIAVADHDNPERLVLVRIEVETGRPVSSPSVAQAAIDTDRELAAQFTLLNANGSTVQFGPMTPIPLEGSLLWARSVVVTGTADRTVPRLYRVVAVSNGLVGEANDTAAAISAAAEAVE